MSILQLLLIFALLVVGSKAESKDPPAYPETAEWKGDLPFNEFGSRIAGYTCPKATLEDCNPKSFVVIGTKGINDPGTSASSPEGFTPGTRDRPGLGEVHIYEQNEEGDWNPALVGETKEQLILKDPVLGTHFNYNPAVPTSKGNDSYFGSAIGVHPSWIIVGAYKTGNVFIYNRVDGKWSNNQYVKILPEVQNGRFGISVAVSATCAAVGASTANAQNGAVYLYQFPDSAIGRENAWAKAPYLTLTGADAKVNFGHSVSMTENYIAVGAPSAPIDGYPKGQVFLFGRGDDDCGNGKCFSGDALLILTGAVEKGQYGFSNFLTDQEVLVGDWAAEFTSATGEIQKQVGQVHMVSFTSDKSTGAEVLTKTADLLIKGATKSTQFGWAVGISPPMEDVNAQRTFAVGGNDNKVWVYGKDGAAWSSNVKAIQKGDGGGYGFALYASDKFVCVGSPLVLGTTDLQKYTGFATMYRVYEDSPLSASVMAAIVCAGLTVACACLMWMRYLCSPKGDPPLMDAKAAAKAARLGFKHHNVAHKNIHIRKGDVETGQRMHLAPQDHNPLRKSGAHRLMKNPMNQGSKGKPMGMKTFTPPGAKSPVLRSTPMDDL